MNSIETNNNTIQLNFSNMTIINTKIENYCNVQGATINVLTNSDDFDIWNIFLKDNKRNGFIKIAIISIDKYSDYSIGDIIRTEHITTEQYIQIKKIIETDNSYNKYFRNQTQGDQFIKQIHITGKTEMELYFEKVKK